MTTRMINTLIRIYDYIYTDKPYKNTKTVAFLVYKGKVVSFGINSDKTSPMQKLYRSRTALKDIENFLDKEHAEINCLRKVDTSINFDKSEIIVISKKCDGTFRLARPCTVCMSAIKDFGIHKVYYTTLDQEVILERI